MAHLFDEIAYTGNMNSDAEDRALPKGDSPFVLNIRNGATGYEALTGVSTFLNGNIEISAILCPYTNYTGLPAGINTAIGYFEDVINNSIIWCNYNSNGKHGIYRFYPDKTDAANPFGIAEQVIQYNFNWQPGERITSFEYFTANSGDLLYWTDSQGLHEINLDRANVVNKRKSWRLYFVNITLGAPFFNLNVQDFNGALILQYGLNMQGHSQDLPTYLNYIVTQLNAQQSVVTATTCDCYLEITENSTTAWTLLVPAGVCTIVPDNWYGTQLSDFLFVRAVAPLLFPPKLTYQQDPTRALNNVKNRVFQGAAQLFFHDGEESVLSVASQIPIDNLQCDGTSNPLYNYIDINLNNPDFIANLNIWLVRIKQIAIIVREHNDGIWKTVEILSPCDLLDYANSAFILHYKFYNDILATPVDTTTATALDSGIPILADSSNTIFNRGVMGGITQGRDAPDCVQADYTIEIGAKATKPTKKITGKIRILSYGLSFTQAVEGGHSSTFSDFYPAASKYPYWKPPANCRGGIFHNAAANPAVPAFWGGGSINSTNQFGIRAGMETTYDQRSPGAGFPVYTAGKGFLTISKQINIGLPTDGFGALDTSTQSDVDTIGAFYQNGGDIYSTFELNVTDGDTYVITIADPRCSFNDTLTLGATYNLNAGVAYQKTSANVWGYFDAAGNWFSNKEITVRVSGADVDVGTFIIQDLAPPWDAKTSGTGTDQWQPANIYLYDGSANPLGVTNADMNSGPYEGESVEKAIVVYGNIGGTLGWTNIATTDRNGYYFGITPGTVLGGFNVEAFQVGTAPNFNTKIIGASSTPEVWTGTFTDLYAKTLKPLLFGSTSTFGPGLIWGFVTSLVANARTNCSTFIEGRIVDQNNHGVSGVDIVYQVGRAAFTDINGNYQVLAFGDMITPNLSNFAGTFPVTNGPTSNDDRIVDSLIVSASPLCVVTYPNGQIINSITITPISANGSTAPPPYSPTAVYRIATFIINETLLVNNKAQKRGGKKIYGIRFYDIAGRVTSVVKMFEAYIPFPTEDLSQYTHVINPLTGLPYTTLTVLGGQPLLTWFLQGSPPKDAAYYQIMWIVDGIYGNYLDWVANSVQYVSAFANDATAAPAINTSFANGDYIGALISISNIVAYLQENPDSQVGYSYTPGDRMRLVNDRSSILLNTPGIYTYSQGIYDFEITGTDTNGNLIVKLPLLPFEIQSGFTIEIYTPQTVSAKDTQVFYEVGEVYKCTAPGSPNNAYGVLSAALTSGDTYWRGMEIPVADPLTNFTETYAIIVEANSISPFYSSLDSDINPTRTGTIDPYLKQIYYRDRIIVSDQFEEGTAYNGLSFCVGTNTTDLGAQLGNAARLIVIGKLLYAIMRNSTVMNTVGVVSLQYAQATNTVEAISSDFLGTQYPSRENIGTDLPATIVPIDGIIYGGFALRKNFWRHSQDGVIEISRNDYTGQDANGRPMIFTRMRNYFLNLFVNGAWDAVSIFDKRYKEYITTVWPNLQDSGTFSQAGHPAQGLPFSYGFNGLIIANYKPGQVAIITFTDTHGIQYTLTVTVVVIGGRTVWFNLDTDNYTIAVNAKVVVTIAGQPVTIAWNETNNGWRYTCSRIPECYASLGDDIFTFKNGGIWIEDKNPVQNNWYGVQYQSQITFVFNDHPGAMKLANSFILETTQADGNNAWFTPVGGVTNLGGFTSNGGQASTIPVGIFKQIREKWFAPVKKDINDQTVNPPINRLSQGRPLVGSTLRVVLTNAYTGVTRLRKFVLNYSLNERTSK